MAKIAGRYINLKRSTERRKQIESQFKILGLINTYKRFEAVEGDANEAKSRGLSCGELGIWRSWLKLLREEGSKEIKEYDYLHIMEDDIIITKDFFSLTNKLSAKRPKCEIIATDMYVNPSVYRAISKDHMNRKLKREYAVYTDLYTGCCVSMLIHKECIDKVLTILENNFKEEKLLLPLDNFLRYLVRNNKLVVGRCAPFVTTINKSSIEESTIQKRKESPQVVLLTQELCTVLRQHLSTYEPKGTVQELTELMRKIAELNEDNTKEMFEADLIRNILDICDSQQLLRYQYDRRLEGQPDNEQMEI